MSTSVYSVTLENAQEIVQLLKQHLTEKKVFFDGHTLWLSSHMAHGSGMVTVDSIEIVNNLVICVYFRFEVDTKNLKRNFLIPILQDQMPMFDVSTISIRKDKVIVISSHVTKSFDLVSKLGFDYSFLPDELGAYRFILDAEV